MNKHSSQSAFSLIELVIASATASLLLAGLASSVYIAGRAIDIAEDSSGNMNHTVIGLDQLVRDLHHARGFHERTATSVHFTIPDRNGDGIPDGVRYAWSGTPGDPITYELNGQDGGTIITNVTSLDFDYILRTTAVNEVTVAEPPEGSVTFETFAEAKLASDGTSLTIDAPASIENDDLLIACVVTDGNNEASLTAPSGWNTIVVRRRDGDVTMGVWWKLAASEPSDYDFTWSSGQQSYGWVMRFSGHDVANPVNMTADDVGQSNAPVAPAVTTSIDNCMILRVGGFDDDDIGIDSPGMASHSNITMDESENNDSIFSSHTCAGGAAYTLQPTAGDAGTAAFSLEGLFGVSEQFVVVTIAIAPEASE